jgi:flagellar biosynthesis protein FliP
MTHSLGKNDPQRRNQRALAWIVTAALCLVCCQAANSADSTPRSKTNATGRVTPNSPSAGGIAEARATSAKSDPQRASSTAPESDPDEAAEQNSSPAGFRPEQLFAPGGVSSTMGVMALMTILSLVPSILVMTTCFIRFIIVTSLIRQALGTQQLPPNNVLMALSLFLTCLVMSPVWRQSYEEGIKPYTQADSSRPAPSLSKAFDDTVRPVRQFMFEQIETAHNQDALFLFLDYQDRFSGKQDGRSRSANPRYRDVSLPTLASAYILSELKVAFVIGFQIFLPFLVIDLVVSTVLTSMGMMMLPPTLVSFPFKLLLFVLIDGWTLTVGMLLESIHPSA